VFDDGRTKCWGQNDKGQLGYWHGSADTLGNAPGEMGDALPFLHAGEGRRVLKLSAGIDWFCALLDTREVKCWGSNSYGNLGLNTNVGFRSLTELDGTPSDERDTIVDLGSDAFCRPLRVVDVAAMQYSACALFESGRVKCWGEGTHGRTGLGSYTDTGKSAGGA
jgi:alpha-tubulin suppressor-like RCC1 family protein